ncbi:MAG: DUF4912 domain-containing protein, partial [Sulfurimonas sp.]
KEDSKELPKRYNKDKLVLLLINPNSSFIYWEITDKTVEKLGINPKNVELSFKLFDENHLEIVEFSSPFTIGDYYINHTNTHKAIYVKLFLKVGEKLEYILSSNLIGALDKTLKFGKYSSLLDENVSDDLIYTSTLLGGK